MRGFKTDCLVIVLALFSGAVWAKIADSGKIIPIIVYLFQGAGEKFDTLFIGKTGTLNDTGFDWGANALSGNNPGCSSDIDAGQDCSQGRDFIDDDDSEGHAGFSFVKLNSNGESRPASAGNWQCVGDLVTGLVWNPGTVYLYQPNGSYK